MIVVKPEQIHFISKYIDENTCVCGPRASGLTTMAMIETAYALKIGLNVFVCTYSSYDANVFADGIKKAHKEINIHLPGKTSINTTLDIFGVPSTSNQKGKYKDLIIFDSSYSEFCRRGFDWKHFAKTISVYTHTEYSETLASYRRFSIQKEELSYSSYSCPKCSRTMTKKKTEGLFFSGDTIEVMKCTNCGYCN